MFDFFWGTDEKKDDEQELKEPNNDQFVSLLPEDDQLIITAITELLLKYPEKPQDPQALAAIESKNFKRFKKMSWRSPANDVLRIFDLWHEELLAIILNKWPEETRIGLSEFRDYCSKNSQYLSEEELLRIDLERLMSKNDC